MNKKFILLFIIIAFLGILLRLHNYDRIPPFGETGDEFIYPWAGLSLIEKGIPESWSPFGSYPIKYNLTAWGQTFTMVKPFIEKPLLYPLISGLVSLLVGQQSFTEVRLTTIRLIPILLSSVSIIFLGLLVNNIWGKYYGLLTALLYATIPTIVLGNRLSLTENLLIPIVLIALWIVFRPLNQTTPHLLGILSIAAIHTKQVGFTLPLTLILLLFLWKYRREAFIVGVYGAIGGLLYDLIVYAYDWNLFLAVSTELKNAHSLGLPEAVFTLLRFPGIGHKESIFLDGSMLLGFILLFAAPWWLRLQNNETTKQSNNLLLLLFPFIYITSVVIGEGGTTWYGWHLFPLYPFLAILLNLAIVNFWKSRNFFQGLVLILILGSSSLRFIYLIGGNSSPNWQVPLGLLIGLFGLVWLTMQIKIQQTFIALLGVCFILINIYTVVNLSKIYPAKPQPLPTHENTN